MGAARSVLAVFVGADCFSRGQLFLPGLAVFAEAVCAECAHIAVGCTADRCYKWVPRVYGADTRVCGRGEHTRTHIDQHLNHLFPARA